MPEISVRLLARHPQIVLCLQVDPGLRIGAKCRSEPDAHVGRDANVPGHTSDTCLPATPNALVASTIVTRIGARYRVLALAAEHAAIDELSTGARIAVSS